MNLPRKVKVGHSQAAPSVCAAKCEAIDTIMICILMQIKLTSTRKVLQVRVFGTRNRPIVRLPFARKLLRLPRLKF